MLNFYYFDRVMSVDVKIHPVSRDIDWNNKICGSALLRKKVESKPYRYQLKPVLNSAPVIFENHYKMVIKQSKQPTIDGGMVVKDVKKYWELQKNKYFRSNIDNLHESMLYLEPVKDIQVKKSWDSRPLKKLSETSKRKIRRKINSWYYTEFIHNGKNVERTYFNFFTFTVTTPKFSHEKTYKAWTNFLKNLGMMYGDKFNYLWVAELQDGTRSMKVANHALKLFSEGVNVDYNKKRYKEFTEKAMSPTNNVHFHLLVDRGYNVQILNKLWLTCLENQGARRFNNEGKEYQPCDVRAVKDFAKLKTYLTKYVTKSDCELKGALWNCSNTVSKFATSLSDCLDVSGLDLTLCKIEKEVKGVVKSFQNVVKKQFEGIVAYFFQKPTNWLIKKLKPLIEFNLRLRYPQSYPLPYPDFYGIAENSNQNSLILTIK